jgi:hypothetical protein
MLPDPCDDLAGRVDADLPVERWPVGRQRSPAFIQQAASLTVADMRSAYEDQGLHSGELQSENQPGRELPMPSAGEEERNQVKCSPTP